MLTKYGMHTQKTVEFELNRQANKVAFRASIFRMNATSGPIHRLKQTPLCVLTKLEKNEYYSCEKSVYLENSSEKPLNCYVRLKSAKKCSNAPKNLKKC